MSLDRLDRYRELLDRFTAESTDPALFDGAPTTSRYESFRFAFEHFARNGGRTIVELGTIRSYVHGGLPGCNEDDKRYWTPDAFENWDWGAGLFSRMAAECLEELDPRIVTVDLVRRHVRRCKVVTHDYRRLFDYRVSDSVKYLRKAKPASIDLLYLDTGDVWPIEPTAQLQLAEARTVVERGLLRDRGLILIDDVRNATPRRFGEESSLGKAKYSIPYLVDNGFEIVFDGYQVALAR